MEIIVRKPTGDEQQEAGSWPEWSKEVSEFPWSYDARKTCLILEGSATVVTEDGSEANFGPGDWVVFPRGLKCTWKITEPIRKKYNFG